VLVLPAWYCGLDGVWHWGDRWAGYVPRFDAVLETVLSRCEGPEAVATGLGSAMATWHGPFTRPMPDPGMTTMCGDCRDACDAEERGRIHN
jgi:hypothetical protein